MSMFLGIDAAASGLTAERLRKFLQRALWVVREKEKNRINTVTKVLSPQIKNTAQKPEEFLL